MPGFVGLPEIVLLLVVALLVFGPKKLPEMGRSLGKGMREFKDSVSGSDKDAPTAADDLRVLDAGEPVGQEAFPTATNSTTAAAAAATVHPPVR